MNTYRKLKHETGKGVIFGVLCQMELLGRREYSEVCSRAKGYPEYGKCLEMHPVEAGTPWKFVRVRAGDCIMVRQEKVREWKKEM